MLVTTHKIKMFKEFDIYMNINQNYITVIEQGKPKSVKIFFTSNNV